MKIALGTFKDNGEELAGFLEPRVGTKPSMSGDSVEIEDEAVRAGVKPRHVKTYIKRFLYMKGARKNYRVFVSGKELTIQEIVLGEKEEKEEEKKEEAEKELPKEEAEGAEATPEKVEAGSEAAEAPAEMPEAGPEEAKPEKAAKPKKAARKPRTKKKADADT